MGIERQRPEFQKEVGKEIRKEDRQGCLMIFLLFLRGVIVVVGIAGLIYAIIHFMIKYW